MNRAVVALLASLCISLGALAAPVSPASVEKLLALTQVEKMLGSVRGQTDSMVASATARMLEGRQVSPEQRERLEAFQKKSMASMREEISWEKLKPLYIRLYTETFTQEEIDGLIAFYESPAGQAYLAKMPTVMQKSMAMMQELMVPMMRRLVSDAEDLMKAGDK